MGGCSSVINPLGGQKRTQHRLQRDRNSCLWRYFLPHIDKGDEFGGEAPLLRVAELRRVSSHHLSQLIKHTVPLWVGKPSRGQLILKHIALKFKHTESGKLQIWRKSQHFLQIALFINKHLLHKASLFREESRGATPHYI